jgi:hypothetical protein
MSRRRSPVINSSYEHATTWLLAGLGIVALVARLVKQRLPGCLDATMARVLMVMAILLLALPAKPDECDGIVETLIAQTPDLRVDKRVLAEGVDIVYLKHPQAKALSVFCPAPPMSAAALSLDWLEGLPPPSYFQLIGKLGSILTGVSADAISAGAIECQKRALASKEEDGDLDSGGIRFQCQAFIRSGGGTALTLARSANWPLSVRIGSDSLPASSRP